MAKTTVLVLFQAKPGMGDKLRAALTFPAEATKGVPGFVSRQLLTEPATPDRLTEISVWESAQHHQQFMAGMQSSPAFAALGQLLASYPEPRYLADA